MNFKEAKYLERKDLFTTFGELLIGDSFVMTEALDIYGFDGETLILYTKVSGVSALRLNTSSMYKLQDIDLESKVTEIEIEVSTVRLK